MSDSVRPHRWQPIRLPFPGILKARTLEWVAISFSNAWKWKVKVKSLSRVRLLATPWTVAHQAPPSMGFSRQEYWSGVPLPSPAYGPYQVLKHRRHSEIFVELITLPFYFWIKKISNGSRYSFKWEHFSWTIAVNDHSPTWGTSSFSVKGPPAKRAPSHLAVQVLVVQSCPTLCDPMDCSSPGSSVHGIFQARILEWVAISYSRGSSPPRDWTQVSCVAGQVFTVWATREALGPPGAHLLLLVRDCPQPHWLSCKSPRMMICLCLWMWMGKLWCDFLKAALLGITLCVCVCNSLHYWINMYLG